MNRFVLVCVAGLVLALTACAASVPMAPKTLDAEAKEFSLPPPDRAKIYVYRDQTMGFALETYLGLDDRYRVGAFGPKTYAVLAVKPGEHTLISRVKEEVTRLSVLVAGGSNYFVWQKLEGDLNGPVTKLQVMDEDMGERGVARCNLIDMPPSFLPPPVPSSKPGGEAQASDTPVSPPVGIKDVPAPSKMLAVFEFQAKDLEEDVLNTLSDEVRAGVVKGLRGRGVGVMTHESMLASIKDKGKGDCAEGACEVETARNINADYLVAGKLARVGQNYLVTLKLLETRGGSLLGTENVQAASLIALKHALADKARALVARPLGASAARE